MTACQANIEIEQINGIPDQQTAETLFLAFLTTEQGPLRSGSNLFALGPPNTKVTVRRPFYLTPSSSRNAMALSKSRRLGFVWPISRITISLEFKIPALWKPLKAFFVGSRL